MAKTIIGIFTEKDDVINSVDALRDMGLNPQDFSIVMKDSSEAADIGENTGVDVAGGAVSGATTGALLGGLAGLLAAIAIPGLGAFFIGGPIATALGLTGAAASTVSGAATGAVAGGLLGALMGLGLSEDEAKEYETRINEGAILVAVPVREEDTSAVHDVFNSNNASDVKTVNQTSETVRSRSTTRTHADAYDEAERPSSTQYTHAYAGAKGGATRRKERETTSGKKGWHGDSGGHSRAAKGEEVKE